MLCRAKRMLPRGTTFIIGSAWRSARAQKEAFAQFVKGAAKKRPGVPKSRILREAREYVAPWKGPRVSGHMTGGAVDLRLFRNGKKVPMKSRKLSYQENARSLQPKLPPRLQKKPPHHV